MYIAICGNTGAGKSTLGKYIEKYLSKEIPVQYIDENEFHHELIQQMFDNPKEYAYLIQINFLIQRTLKIKFLSEHGKIFIIERSLEEDYLFALRYYQQGNFNSEAFDSYKQLWESCTKSIPAPSLYLYLYSDSAEVLTQRVIQGNEQLRRKQELQGNALLQYIREMNLLYNEWFDNLNKDKLKVPILTKGFDNQEVMSPIFETILSLLD